MASELLRRFKARCGRAIEGPTGYRGVKISNGVNGLYWCIGSGHDEYSFTEQISPYIRAVLNTLLAQPIDSPWAVRAEMDWLHRGDHLLFREQRGIP